MTSAAEKKFPVGTKVICRVGTANPTGVVDGHSAMGVWVTLDVPQRHRERILIQEENLLLAPVEIKVVRKPVDREDALYRVRRDYNLRFGHLMLKASTVAMTVALVSFFGDELITDGSQTPSGVEEGPALTCRRADHSEDLSTWDPVKKHETLAQLRAVHEKLSKLVKESADTFSLSPKPVPLPEWATAPSKYVDMILTVNKKPADETLKVTIVKVRE